MSKLSGIRRNSPNKRGKKAQYFDETVRLYYEEGLNGVEISRVLPVPNSNIYRWLDDYDMQKKVKESSVKEQRRETEKERPRMVSDKALSGTGAVSGLQSDAHQGLKGPMS